MAAKPLGAGAGTDGDDATGALTKSEEGFIGPDGVGVLPADLDIGLDEDCACSGLAVPR